MHVSNTKTSNMKHRLIGFIGKVLLSFVLLLILVVLNWDDLKSSRPKLPCFDENRLWIDFTLRDQLT